MSTEKTNSYIIEIEKKLENKYKNDNKEIFYAINKFQSTYNQKDRELIKNEILKRNKDNTLYKIKLKEDKNKLLIAFNSNNIEINLLEHMDEVKNSIYMRMNTFKHLFYGFIALFFCMISLVVFSNNFGEEKLPYFLALALILFFILLNEKYIYIAISFLSTPILYELITTFNFFNKNKNFNYIDLIDREVWVLSIVFLVVMIIKIFEILSDLKTKTKIMYISIKRKIYRVENGEFLEQLNKELSNSKINKSKINNFLSDICARNSNILLDFFLKPTVKKSNEMGELKFSIILVLVALIFAFLLVYALK